MRYAGCAPTTDAELAGSSDQPVRDPRRRPGIAVLDDAEKNTDKLLIKGKVTVRVCRAEGAGTCVDAGPPVTMSSGVKGSYSEILPSPGIWTSARAGLLWGVEVSHRPVGGFVESGIDVAGAPPGPVQGLTAEVARQVWVELENGRRQHCRTPGMQVADATTFSPEGGTGHTSAGAAGTKPLD